MQSQTILHSAKRKIDLIDVNIEEVKEKPVKPQTKSIERKAKKNRKDFRNIKEENHTHIQLLTPENDLDINNDQNYDSRVTFSPEAHEIKNSKISALEEKLMQSEKIILELHSKIALNDSQYKEKYGKMTKEIRELEADNISLHQIIKTKASDLEEFKNENSEYKHIISSNNMLSQKQNLNEEELRIKIEDLMNKTTELNFLLRQKEEEILSLKSKNKLSMIDLNNSQNVEKALNKEIQDLKKSRGDLEKELQGLKDQNCKYQVQIRE